MLNTDQYLNAIKIHTQEAQFLLEEVGRLQADKHRILQNAAKITVKDLMVDDCGRPTAILENPYLLAMAQLFVEMYRESEGKNYVSVSVTHPDYPGERFEITVQRMDGKTPSEMVAELQQQLEKS